MSESDFQKDLTKARRGRTTKKVKFLFCLSVILLSAGSFMLFETLKHSPQNVDASIRSYPRGFLEAVEQQRIIYNQMLAISVGTIVISAMMLFGSLRWKARTTLFKEGCQNSSR